MAKIEKKKNKKNPAEVKRRIFVTWSIWSIRSFIFYSSYSLKSFLATDFGNMLRVTIPALA